MSCFFLTALTRLDFKTPTKHQIPDKWCVFIGRICDIKSLVVMYIIDICEIPCDIKIHTNLYLFISTHRFYITSSTPQPALEASAGA